MPKYDSDKSSLTLGTVRGQGASSAPSEWVESGQSAHVQEPGPCVVDSLQKGVTNKLWLDIDSMNLVFVAALRSGNRHPDRRKGRLPFRSNETPLT